MTPPLHPLPKNPKRWLPKYNTNDVLTLEEHIHNFMLEINLKGVTKEDVVSRIFPYTFEGVIAAWYFSLPNGFIKDWDTFE